MEGVILELLDRDGIVRARHQIADTPLTVGRALSNHVVLDDPYADAEHLRIFRDESGTLVAEDVGSTNGLRDASDRATRVQRIALRPGTELLAGRTRLRVRRASEFTAPALVDDEALLPAAARGAEPVSASDVGAPVVSPTAPSGEEAPAPAWVATWVARLESLVRRVEPTRTRVALAVGACAVFCVAFWLDRPGDRTTGPAIGMGILAMASLGLWAGLWAFGARLRAGRGHFLTHYAIACAWVLVLAPYMAIESVARFLWPRSIPGQALSYVTSGIVLLVLLGAHIAYASRKSARRRWRTAVIVVVAINALGLWLDVGYQPRRFSSRIEHSEPLLPIDPRYAQADTPERFAAEIAELKVQLDELAKRPVEGGADPEDEDEE